MDELLAAFSQRVAVLKTLSNYRAPADGPPFTADPRYAKIVQQVESLENRIGEMRLHVKAEREALERGSIILQKLDCMKESLDYMSANIPRHLPARKPIAASSNWDDGDEPEYVTEQRNDENVPHSRNSRQQPLARNRKPSAKHPLGTTQSTGGSENGESSHPFKTPTVSAAVTKKKLVTTIAPITVSEFESLPKYQIGRLTRDKLNDNVQQFSLLVQDMYALLRIPVARMTKPQRDIYWEHKKISTPETSGHAFVTEKDVKDKDIFSKSSFRLDPAGRTVVAVLRHLGKIREVRGGGHTRLVLI
ncbi:Spindle and kinetochore-associated protein 1 [Gaertneriomyces sp. JEL0708]|nr:Spindle and kinetochore-associated protein 1 [Gaertneriomyces sp. JEL0708]